MEDETPPKRVTRARAAAKTKPTAELPEVKIATASTKAKATRTTTAASTKRKTRADEISEDTKDAGDDKKEIMDQPPVKPKSTRGRPRKAVKPEDEAEHEVEEDEQTSLPQPARSTRGRSTTIEKESAPAAPAPAPGPVKTRGRPKKIMEETSEPAVVEMTKATRGRAKKVETVEVGESIETAPEPIKKSTRGRPAAAAKTTAARKTVKFEEPHDGDKENVLPVSIDKTKEMGAVVETGLKAKPVRKAPTAVATRVGRGRAKAENKTPLSPKKATQVAKSDSNSEDELATMEKTPMKPLQKSPLKAPGSLFGTAKKLDFTTSIVANRAVLPDSQNLGASLMGSPARRPPQSPFKDGLKTSPKRAPGLGDSILKSPFKASMYPPKPRDMPFKASMLQSPARRPQSPTKVSLMGSPSRAGSIMNATPKAAPFSTSRLGATPGTLTKNAYRPGNPLFGSAVKKNGLETEQQQPAADSLSTKAFSGRLSSVMPRHADVDLQEATVPAAIPEDSETDTICVIPVESAVESLLLQDPMIVDGTFVDNIQSTTPPHSPPRHSLGSFSLHRDEDPFQGSDSEDELASASPKYSPVHLSTYNISSRDFASPSTPTPFVAMAKTPNAAVMGEIADPRSAAASKSVRARRDPIEFVPLAQQLSNWLAASPESEKSSTDEEAQVSPTKAYFPEASQPDIVSLIAASPVKSTFFDDEMSIRDVTPSETVDVVMSIHGEGSSGIVDTAEELPDEVGFSPTVTDEEDIALAAEAEEMSLLGEPAVEVGEAVFAGPAMEAEDDIFDALVVSDDIMMADLAPPNESNIFEVVDSFNGSTSTRALSEASQEYGDENAIPIDPALVAFDKHNAGILFAQAPVQTISTPIRAPRESEHVVHTVSKVPLKPAALDTPSQPAFDFSKERPATVSRMRAQRQAPAPPVPATSVTSRTLPFNLNVTPAKSNGWSTAGTPTRTPKRDIDSQVLKGAVVFVDVHTSEGADASTVFVELLGQMGARCVKSWTWNPNSASSSPEDSDKSSDKDSKIGITHVVYKDGGKRTLEKVRESRGVVCCVGVGWVLDCERAQSWLDEGPYSIDTSLVPRGGHRRRKSMEPRQLQNQNGTLTPRPNRPAATPRSVSANHIGTSPTKEFLNTPRTVGSMKMDRRKSTIWELSPSSDGDEDKLMLSPVPVTPAPATISQYAEHVLDGDSGEPTPYFLRNEELVMKTAPANRVAEREGSGILGERSDEGGNGNGGRVLMQRLLLARRKSLQFAPKIGSPLARGASYGA